VCDARSFAARRPGAEMARGSGYASAAFGSPETPVAIETAAPVSRNYVEGVVRDPTASTHIPGTFATSSRAFHDAGARVRVWRRCGGRFWRQGHTCTRRRSSFRLSPSIGRAGAGRGDRGGLPRRVPVSTTSSTRNSAKRDGESSRLAAESGELAEAQSVWVRSNRPAGGGVLLLPGQGRQSESSSCAADERHDPDARKR